MSAIDPAQFLTFRKAAEEAGLPSNEVQALFEALTAPGGLHVWHGAVRTTGTDPMARLVGLVGSIVLMVTAGDGPVWRLAVPVDHIDSLRHVPGSGEEPHRLKISAGELRLEVLVRPDDAYGDSASLTHLADALLRALAGSG